MHPLCARWLSEVDRAAAEMQALLVEGEKLDAAGADAAASPLRWMGLAAGVAAIYSRLELVMKEIADRVDQSAPRGEDWHRSLLRQLALPVPGLRQAVIAESTFALLEPLRRFRHVARNVYAMEIDSARVAAAAEQVPPALAALRADVAAFCESGDVAPTGGARAG